MKFVPVKPRSPRSLRRATLDCDPPIQLELVRDPVKNCNYLSLGVGYANVRRTWLSESETARLVSLIVSLTMEKAS